MRGIMTEKDKWSMTQTICDIAEEFWTRGRYVSEIGLPLKIVQLLFQIRGQKKINVDNMVSVIESDFGTIRIKRLKNKKKELVIRAKI